MLEIPQQKKSFKLSEEVLYIKMPRILKIFRIFCFSTHLPIS